MLSATSVTLIVRQGKRWFLVIHGHLGHQIPECGWAAQWLATFSSKEGLIIQRLKYKASKRAKDEDNNMPC